MLKLLKIVKGILSPRESIIIENYGDAKEFAKTFKKALHQRTCEKIDNLPQPDTPRDYKPRPREK